MLDAETAAREQAEEENRKLRDEMLRIRGEAAPSMQSSRGSRMGRKQSVISRSTISDREADRTGAESSITLVEVDLLRQENAELRREVSAQTSMLTSRNREKERLYQEIEDLKLGQRREGGRSVAGDSIFERSASRAQEMTSSHASDTTRVSSADVAERENLEVKNGELRDQVSTLKLENRNIKTQLGDCMHELETLDREYQADVEQAEEELRVLQAEKDRVYQLLEERETALEELKTEAQQEIDAVGDELDQKYDDCQRLESELRNQQENFSVLQAEMRSASEGIIRLEEDAQSNLHKYRIVQQELDDANRELEEMEKTLFESNSKVQRLSVQQESSQNEIAFLREEQDGDKIKIGDLESELKTCHMSLQSEKEKSKGLDHRLAEERYQREVVDSKEKQEVQRILNDLNREASTAKDEARKLKKKLLSQEIEANTWKERLMELENSLRETLGDLNGTRSSLLTSITKLQKELESTTLELEGTRSRLDEKEALLRNRDSLLESHGLETRKLADLLERERQAHRADKHSFEQSLKSHHQASRSITQSNSRITELETARNQERKRFNSTEQQLRDQLSERNSMFLTLWKRLSAMCGPDWAHSNSLINGNLPSQEVIGNILFWPGFSRNLLLAVKTVENVIGGFKSQVKAVERDLTKGYQALENTLNNRIKKLERMEDMVQSFRNEQQNRGSSNLANSEVSKVKGENRLLKAELNLLQSQSRARAAAASANSTTSNTSPGRWSHGSSDKHANARKDPGNSASNVAASSLTRYSSSTTLSNSPGGRPRPDRSNSATSRGSSIPQPTNFWSTSTLNSDHNNNNNRASSGKIVTAPSQGDNYQQIQSSNEPSQEKWILRLRELERRLKSERDARLKDREGARQRLLESSAQNDKLRAQLDREKMKGITSSSPFGGGDGTADDRRENHLAISEGSTSARHKGDDAGSQLKSVSEGHDNYGRGRANEDEKSVRHRSHDRRSRSRRHDDREHEHEHEHGRVRSRGQHRSRDPPDQHGDGAGTDEYDAEEDEDDATGTGLYVEVEV